MDKLGLVAEKLGSPMFLYTHKSTEAGLGGEMCVENQTSLLVNPIF
jgi:hypothetical protein